MNFSVGLALVCSTGVMTTALWFNSIPAAIIGGAMWIAANDRRKD